MYHCSDRYGDRGIVPAAAFVLVVLFAAAGAGVVASESTLDVRTSWADPDGEHTAVAAANVTDLGPTGNATVWIEYRVADSSAGWDQSANATVSSTGAVVFELSNLHRNTTYEYRSVAAESDGNQSAAGETRTLTTLALSPVVSLESPIAVNETSATLHAEVVDTGDSSAVNVSFEYRAQGASTWQTTPAQRLTSVGSVVQPIDGLSANTTYEYRAVAVDAEGDTDRSLTATLTTDTAFSVATRQATRIADSSATLNGEILDFGGASDATASFEFAPVGSSDTQTVAATLWNDGTVYANVSGLQPGTTYEFVAKATASDGDTDAGAVLNFTTDTRASVLTGAASTVTESSATVSANVTDLGGAESGTVSVQYRLAGADTWQETAGQTVSTTGAVTVDLAGLASDTDYEYRAVLEASDGDTATGTVRRFTTDTAESPSAVDSLVAYESSPPNPHAEVFVDWAVSDADGDLATVTVEITDFHGRTVYSEDASVDGSSASGSVDTKVKHGAGETYTVTVTVTDGAGNTATRQTTVAA